MRDYATAAGALVVATAVWSLIGHLIPARLRVAAAWVVLLVPMVWAHRQFGCDR